jgi:phage terminase small subunit
MKRQRLCEVLHRTGNRTTAYKEAGYNADKGKTSIAQRVSRILQSPAVKAELARLKRVDSETRLACDMWDLDRLRAEFVRLRDLAETAGDLSTATRAVEDIARTMGAFSDVLTLDTNKMRVYSEAEQAEARRLAALSLLSGEIADALPVIDVDVLPAPTDAEAGRADVAIKLSVKQAQSNAIASIADANESLTDSTQSRTIADQSNAIA